MAQAGKGAAAVASAGRPVRAFARSSLSCRGPRPLRRASRRPLRGIEMLSFADPALILGADGFLEAMSSATSRNAAGPVPPSRAPLAISPIRRWWRRCSARRLASGAFPLRHRQRTGPVHFDMQADLLSVNARIDLNALYASRRFQPQAKLISTGSSCAFPERDTLLRRRLPERSAASIGQGLRAGKAGAGDRLPRLWRAGWADVAAPLSGHTLWPW